MSSIRGRLTLLLIAAILLIVVASFGFVYVLVSQSLRAQFDTDLAGRADTLVRLAEWWDGEPPEDGEVYEDLGDDEDDLVRFDFSELSMPEFEDSDEADYFQVWDAAGVVQARSPSLEGENLPAPNVRADGHLRQIRLLDGRRGQIVFRRFAPEVEYDSVSDRPDTTYVLALATSTEDLAATLANVRTSLITAGLGTIGLSALLMSFVVRRGLRPLGRIATEIESMGDGNLDQRIDASQTPNELHGIATRLNGLLDRLQTVLDRERRFTDDVAHELRTPLAELRTLAEVSARREAAAPADRQSFLDVLDAAVRLDRLTSTLLDLSRCASGNMGTEIQQVDLDGLVATTWKPFSGVATKKQLRVNIAANGGGEISTDPVVLRTILSNLFSNAVDYTPSGGEIRFNSVRSNALVEITLSNTTNDLAEDDLPRLAQKFWRKRGPDSNAHGHLGLGMSLVEALAKVLNASFDCSLPSRTEFRARLRVPNSQYS